MDAGECRQSLVAQGLVAGDVLGDDSQKVVRLAEESFGVADLGDVLEAGFELVDGVGVLSVHRHVHEDLELKSERCGVDDGAVTADDAGAFEVPKPAMAGGDAEVDALGECRDRHTTVDLQHSKDLAIHIVHTAVFLLGECAGDKRRQRSIRDTGHTLLTVTTVFDAIPIVAALFAVPQFGPQIHKVRSSGDTAGLSWSWAALTSVNNAAWMVYFTLSHYLTALVPAASATSLAGALAVMLARRRLTSRRTAALIIVWVATLTAAFASAGRAGLGTMLAAAFLVQVTPSVWTAYRSGDASGISQGTWLLILAEVSCWLVYGIHRTDPRLIGLGLTGVAASLLMLARLARTRHHRTKRPHDANRLGYPLRVHGNGTTQQASGVDEYHVSRPDRAR